MKAILVDDEIIALAALKRRMDWQKYGVTEVFTATSMRGAQDVFRASAPELLLCDIEMPEGDGLELFEWVKSYYAQTECIYVTCHQDFDYMRRALTLGSFDYILKPVDYEELGRVLTRAVKRLNNKRDLRLVAARGEDSPGEDPVARAQHYIRLHISESIYIDDIAAAVHLSAQYLMRLFKKETGRAVLEYITEERIRLARQLLAETRLSVNRVSDRCGYDNYSYFGKVFKRYTGLSPAAYRRAVEEDRRTGEVDIPKTMKQEERHHAD